MFQRSPCTAIAGLLALGCGASAAPASRQSSAPSAPAAPPAGTFPAAQPPPPRTDLPPRPLPDGCTTDVGQAGAPEPRLADVAKSCVFDMTPLTPEPLVVTLEKGALKELPFTITDPTKCVRAAAVGTAGVNDLALSIVDGSDQVYGQDRLHGQVALANFDGPVCLKDPGQYRAVVRMVDGTGSVAVQVWQAD